MLMLQQYKQTVICAVMHYLKMTEDDCSISIQMCPVVVANPLMIYWGLGS